MSELLATVLAPLAPGAVAALAAALFARRAHGAARRLRVALAALGGYLAGHLAIEGPPGLALDVELKDRVAYAALAALAVEALARLRPRAGGAARAALAILLPLYALRFMWRFHWTPLEGAGWSLALAALAAAAARGGASLAAAAPAWLAAGSASAACAAAAAALHLGGSATLGLLAGALGVALLALAVLGRGAAAGIESFAWVHAPLVWGGLFASDLSRASGLCLLAAPAVPWLVERLARGRIARARAALAAAGIVLASLAGAAIELAESSGDEPSGYARPG